LRVNKYRIPLIAEGESLSPVIKNVNNILKLLLSADNRLRDFGTEI